LSWSNEFLLLELLAVKLPDVNEIIQFSNGLQIKKVLNETISNAAGGSLCYVLFLNLFVPVEKMHDDIVL